MGSWINFQSLNHHSSVLLDQIPLHLYKVGIKERKDDERGGGGGDYYSREAINRGTAVLQGNTVVSSLIYISSVICKVQCLRKRG